MFRVCLKPGHLAKDCWKKERKPKVDGDAFVCTVEGVPERKWERHHLTESPKMKFPSALKLFLMKQKMLGGGVALNLTAKNILEKFEISSRMSMSYTPQQNGAAERENRTFVESARSIILC
ncbi:hypothetical protein TNCV_2604801 [Trichonephila clavipes]|nr:hypothetical protein TNCV_2604801 [Trichonephila clavipes]